MITIKEKFQNLYDKIRKEEGDSGSDPIYDELSFTVRTFVEIITDLQNEVNELKFNLNGK